MRSTTGFFVSSIVVAIVAAIFGPGRPSSLRAADFDQLLQSAAEEAQPKAEGQKPDKNPDTAAEGNGATKNEDTAAKPAQSPAAETPAAKPKP
jgi:hypothetical protein